MDIILSILFMGDEKMKLAEALIIRSALKEKIDRLQSSLQSYAVIQEGDTPPEDP
jgi:hypothetical protein